VALPIVALKFWERTSAAPLLSRTIWGSVVQRQFGTRSRSIPLHQSRSIRAPTWPAVRSASLVTTADSVITSWAMTTRRLSCRLFPVLAWRTNWRRAFAASPRITRIRRGIISSQTSAWSTSQDICGRLRLTFYISRPFPSSRFADPGEGGRDFGHRSRSHRRDLRSDRQAPEKAAGRSHRIEAAGVNETT